MAAGGEALRLALLGESHGEYAALQRVHRGGVEQHPGDAALAFHRFEHVGPALTQRIGVNDPWPGRWGSARRGLPGHGFPPWSLPGRGPRGRGLPRPSMPTLRIPHPGIPACGLPCRGLPRHHLARRSLPCRAGSPRSIRPDESGRRPGPARSPECPGRCLSPRSSRPRRRPRP